MNYASVRSLDIANGEGVRTSLFVSGCTNNCPGCFNKEQQDFNYGRPFTPEIFSDVMSEVSSPIISGLSILGGDPLCQNEDGLSQLIALCRCVHSIGKTVWLWTGYTVERVYTREFSMHSLLQQVLLESCDVVIDGPFISGLSSRALVWKGSSNQRVVDMKK